MNYKDSIIIEELKKYYGHHFNKMFAPWRLYASAYIDANKLRYVSTNIDLTDVDNMPFLNRSDGSVTWTPGKLTLISTSSHDKATDYSRGAHTIMLAGINDKYKKVSELVELNGNSEVETKYIYRFLNEASVYKSGNKGSLNFLNTGTIDISTGTTTVSNSLTVPWATILRGEGSASMAGYSLAKYESVYITKIKVNCTGNVAGQFSMWLTNRDAITGLETTEMPYRAITSTFNAVSGGGEVIFDEPYYVKNQTIFFTVSKLTSKSLVSIEACGMVTEGEEVYERDGKAITNIKRSGVRHYIPSNRDSNGKPVIELSKEKMLTKNAKLALKYDTFYSMSRRNNKRKKM